MSDNKAIIDFLIAAGHDPELVARTEKTAQALREMLDNVPMPVEDDLKTVFLDGNKHD